jgi:hypothetical protein
MRLFEGPLVDPLRDAGVDFGMARLKFDFAAEAAPGMPHSLRMKTHEAAENVLATVDVACFLRDRVVELWLARSNEDGIPGMMDRWVAGNHLALGFKMLFIWVRAYQDFMYRCLMFSLGNPPGQGSMNKASTAGNPVNGLLQQEMPNFLPWFEGWRDMRNALKDGAAFEMLINPSGELTLIPIRYLNDGSTSFGPQSATLGVRDMVRALEMSTAITRLAADRLPRN